MVVMVWCVVVMASLSWNLHQTYHMRKEIAFESARALYSQVLSTRLWNATHGPVYVPVSDEVQPNPYLQGLPHREIEGPEGNTLTMVNPAYMTRQISELARTHHGVIFTITSLNPLRPENVPNAWQADALRQFEAGVSEVGFFVEGEAGERQFNYMAPLFADAPCLVCHGHQGYQEGDIRGGLAVSLSFSRDGRWFGLVASHLAIALLGSLIIIALGGMLSRSYRLLSVSAKVDPLTNIPNRGFFNEQLALEWARNQREKTHLGLIMLDIDYFKSFNDTLGHQAGDNCLIHVANLIQAQLERPADFCARYGGEEFVILLPNTDALGAWHIAKKIHQALFMENLQHPASVFGRVTLSAGIVVERGTFDTAEAMLYAADIALYQAKSEGRNRSILGPITSSSSAPPISQV